MQNMRSNHLFTREKEMAECKRLRLRLAHLYIMHGAEARQIYASMGVDPTFASHVLHGRRTSRPFLRNLAKQIRFYHSRKIVQGENGHAASL